MSLTCTAVEKIARNGPTTANMHALINMPHTALAFELMYRPLPQLMLKRALAGIRKLCVPRQRLVLKVCRRYLIHVPAWPAAAMLAGDETKYLAAEVVRMMPVQQQVPLLPHLVASRTRAANEIVLELSRTNPCATFVAEALSVQRKPSPLLEYVNPCALLQMTPYLMFHGLRAELVRALRDNPPIAIGCGVFTWLLENGGDPLSFFFPAWQYPDAVHEALFSTWYYATPHLLERCADEHPAALRALARSCPLVKAAYGWHRRRNVMCGLSRSRRPKPGWAAWLAGQSGEVRRLVLEWV